MRAEILVAALVLVVAVLVFADFWRTDDSPHEHIERPAQDAGRQIFPAPRAGAAAFPFQSAGAGWAGPAPGAGSPGPPERTSLPTDDRWHPDSAQAMARKGSHGARRTWLVRTRLSLLAIIPAAAAALATAGVIRAAGALRSASFHSDISSVRAGAIVSAVVACIAVAVALAAGLWSAILLIRSVLRPLHQLRAAVVGLAEVRLPDALRPISQASVKAAGLSSADEIGDVARAFGQLQGEVLQLAANEAGLRGRVSDMFVELSGRSQSLVERQIRLIDELEQGEQDTERLAGLFRMDHIATRMRRYSQNLLVLAGHELPGRRSHPVTLVDVIRAAASEIEEYERVSLSAQPGIAVAGPAVNDVVHLIAELAENAASRSAPDSPVDITGRTLVSGGVLVDVTDQGVGMNPDQMAQANWRLENPPAADVAVSRNMGLFVVARLAARHGIKVRLQPAKSGGLSALVWLPGAIVSLRDTRAPSGPGPRPAWSAGASRPDFQPRPQAAGSGDEAAVSVASAAPVPAADPAEDGRLPIYEAVESDWFGNSRKPSGDTAAVEGSRASPADQGRPAAKTVVAPPSGGVTTAGLPVRVPRANLVPGAISGPAAAPPAPRSANAVRNRLAGFQRGVSQGRAAVSAVPNHDGEDETC